MKHLFAPWRSKYAGDETDESKQKTTTKAQCIFCKMLQENNNNDENHWILKKFDNTFVILNKYPYNAGHLLVLTKKHEGNLNKLSKEERAELMEVTNICTEILQKTLKNEGFNIGLNLGKVAGAGIPSHLHIHVLPRWKGDTNFMPTIAQTKIISFDLSDIYQKLKKEFDKI